MRDGDAVSHPASYYLRPAMPEALRADQVAAALERDGVPVTTAEPFSSAPHARRIALGSVMPESLEGALRKVRRAVLG
ncbi:hypothetical protein [Burkholderia savannae]|uniref:hypothetical protein n=1 Tax=Burkholderia savannae TaxID=1637837 RepID=UPI001CF772E2